VPPAKERSVLAERFVDFAICFENRMRWRIDGEIHPGLFQFIAQPFIQLDRQQSFAVVEQVFVVSICVDLIAKREDQTASAANPTLSNPSESLSPLRRFSLKLAGENVAQPNCLILAEIGCFEVGFTNFRNVHCPRSRRRISS